MTEQFDPYVALPPAWAFGVIYGSYTDQAQTLAKIDRLIADDYPIDAYWIDSCFWNISTKGPRGYMDFVGDTTAYPDIQGMWDYFHAHTIRAGIWIWDRLNEDGNEAVFHDFEARGFFREVKVNTDTWHNAGGTSRGGWFDFDNPEAVAYVKERFRPLFAQGLDFLKLDAGARLPYVRAGYAMTQELGLRTRGRGFIISHQVDQATPEYRRYPTVWSGDSLPDWDQPNYPDHERFVYGGLRQQVHMVADPAWYEYAYPFLTNDTGGFSAQGRPHDELFIRWTQFSTFGAIMEVFGSMFFASSNAPFTYGPDAREQFRRYTHLRMRLFPYIYSSAHLTRLTGRKMLQGDGVHPDQYLFGGELLVAPVYESGATSRDVYLPDGLWYDYWTGQARAGGGTLRADAPLATIPVFVRAGAIIPMRDYARAIELGSNARLTLDIYPHEVSTFTLFEDDGISLDYLTRGYATTAITCAVADGAVTVTIAPTDGTYRGMPAAREYVLQLRGITAVSGVDVNGAMLPDWEDDGTTITIPLTATAAEGAVVHVRR